jgi:uncharacterized membrane protein YkgB
VHRAIGPRHPQGETVMTDLFIFFQRIAVPFLRIALGLIVLWLGANKFLDPSMALGLLRASTLYPFLATNAFVYAQGVLEVVAALLLIAGVGVRYVGLFLMLLFLGTLSIFVSTPAVSFTERGFPFLSLAGEFLLKDLVLFGAAMTLVAEDAAREGGAAPLPLTVPHAEVSRHDQ